MIRDRLANYAIRQATHRTIESKMFVKNIYQRIIKDETVVKLFAIHAKRYVGQAPHNQRITINLAKTVAELSDSVNDVANALKKGLLYMGRYLVHAIQAFDQSPAMHDVMDTTVCPPTESPTQALSVRRIDCLASCA